MTRRRTTLPVGAVTFLLTDLEGSSRLWQEHPDAMGAAVEHHYALVEDAVDRHHGAFVKSKGEGDSTFSVFARPTDAVAAAVDAQRALANVAWLDGIEIKARAALHTGEAELRDGDYYGNAVNRCARLRDIAHGGQTICSQATAELVADSLVDDVLLLDLGSHRLRDLDRAQGVFQVRHSELRDDFPALRSLEALPNNLPSQLSTFIGREAEIAIVRKLLDVDRLVTLTGSGGCGKSRLALQVAAEVLDAYPDGVWSVELAPLGDPELVPNAVGQAMGIREVPSEPLTHTLERLLAQRRALIVLDNCEHLIDACAALSNALLRSCPQLVVLATSREPLGIEGETTWRVPSLAMPESDESIDTLTTYEAVRLFIDRAVRSRPTFEVNNYNAPAVAQICRRLDGIPLAIELAAARVRVMTPDQIAAGLDDRFRLLGGGARTALPRQRTLEASVDWSYNLLGEDQRTLFRRLSVFVGSFALDSAEAVCSSDDLDRYQVFDVLAQLVDRSLVQAEEDGRYRLLETIRLHGRHKLADAGEADGVSSRHLEHYTELINRARPLIECGGTVEWLRRVQEELDNVRAALDWAIASRHTVEGLALAGAWQGYWHYCGCMEEGRNRILRLLELGGADEALVAQSFVALSEIESRQGRMAESKEHAESAADLARKVGNAFLEVRALAHGGARGRDRAHVFNWGDDEWAEAVSAARCIGDDWAVHMATNEYCFFLVTRGRIPRAIEILEENVASAKAFGDLLNLCLSLGLLGGSAWGSRLAMAEGELREAIAVGEAIGDRWETPYAKVSLSDLLNWRGQWEEARSVVLQAIKETRSSGTMQALGSGLGVLARINMAGSGDADAALAAAEEGGPIGRSVRHFIYSAQTFATGAWAAMAMGDRARADALFAEAIRDGDIAPPTMPYVHWVGALIAREHGNVVEAEGHARAAAKGIVLANAMEVLAGVVATQHEHEEAARLFGAAEAHRGRSGLPRWPSQVAIYEADVDIVRTSLGDAGFKKAWEDGAALSRDDAIAYVMRGRGERKRPMSGWASLTPTELQVVKLVAEGLSNPQIAEKMFISRRTVTTHLTHIFAKLGLGSRSELAAEAVRRAG